MSKLIENMGCVPSNMTTMIQRMKRDGYVMTEKNPNDQRETLVYLTKKVKRRKSKSMCNIVIFKRELWLFYERRRRDFRGFIIKVEEALELNIVKM